MRDGLDLPEWAGTRSEPEGRCRVWCGPLDEDGYPILNRDNRRLRAHRTVWEEIHGPIPSRLCVLHLCDRRSCIHPDHLVLGTQRANRYDRDQKGRTVVPVRKSGRWTGKHRRARAG